MHQLFFTLGLGGFATRKFYRRARRLEGLPLLQLAGHQLTAEVTRFMSEPDVLSRCAKKAVPLLHLFKLSDAIRRLFSLIQGWTPLAKQLQPFPLF